MAKDINIGGRLHSIATGNVVAGADEILDDNLGKKQTQINAETNAAIQAETERAIIAENDRYTKAETYNKTELNNMITTPNQKYATVTATDQTTDVTDVLPATGSADTVYRVGNWDGTQFDETTYSEYSWNGSAYVHITTKTQIDEVFNISTYHASGGTLAKYANLSAALGTNGANIPESLRKGGMSVKFVLTSDNKYIQARCIAQNFTTDVTQWQGVDDVPTAGSDNLVKSGGVSDMYGHYSNHPEYYLYVITDNNGHLLFAIKCDGDVVFSAGIPNQVKEYVESAIDAILEGNDTEKIDCINDIYNFLNDYATSDSLKELLDLKVDKEADKSLIPNRYIKEHEAEEYIHVCTDDDGKILYAVKKDGDFIFGCKIPKSIIGENTIIIDNLRLKQSTFNKTKSIYAFYGCNTLDESIVLPDDCKFVFIGDAYINLNGFKFTGTLLNEYITTSQFGLRDKELDISAFNNLYSLNICPIHMDRDYELADNTNYLHISSYKDLNFRKHKIKVTTARSRLVLFYQSANYASANRFENLTIDCNYLAAKGFNYNAGTRLGIVNNIRIINATKYGISFGRMANFTPTKFPDGTDIPDRNYGGNLKASGIDVWFTYNEEYPSAPPGSVGITLGIADSFFKDLCVVRYETGIYVKTTTNIEEAHPWGGMSGDGTGDDLRVIGFAVCYGACAHLTNCHFDGYYYGLLLDNRSYVTIQDGVWYRGSKVHNGSKLIIDGRFTHPDEYDKGVNVYEGIHAVVNNIFQRGINDDRGVLCSDALVNHVTGSGMIEIPNEV